MNEQDCILRLNQNKQAVREELNRQYSSIIVI